jgi:hypothetical protein
MEQGKMSILCDVRIKSSLREQFQNDGFPNPRIKRRQAREERWGTAALGIDESIWRTKYSSR